MGRPKKFNREEVLEKAMPLFWKQGFASTCLQDLEKATGVNKSGLYSEFKDKEDLFLASLKHYYANNSRKLTLSTEPLGWHNIENFLKLNSQPCSVSGGRGCFGVNSMPELEQLPEEALALVNESRLNLKRQLTKNIAAEKTNAPPESIAELLATFISGMAIEQNVGGSKNSLNRKIEDLMRLLRSM